MPILRFLGFCVVELGQGTQQTDRESDGQTITSRRFIMPLPKEVGAVQAVIMCMKKNEAYTGY